MKDPKNISILVLMLTAVFLTTMIVVSFRQTSQPAMAAAGGMRGAEYILSAGVNEDDEAFIFVINGQSGRMAIYLADDTRDSILPVGKVDFSRTKTFGN
jgi:hypothetical protein